MNRMTAQIFFILGMANYAFAEDITPFEQRWMSAGFEFCEVLANQSSDYVEVRQMHPDYETWFERMRDASRQNPILEQTVSYSTRLVESREMIYTSGPLEAWKRDVHRLTLAYCMNTVELEMLDYLEQL